MLSLQNPCGRLKGKRLDPTETSRKRGEKSFSVQTGWTPRARGSLLRTTQILSEEKGEEEEILEMESRLRGKGSVLPHLSSLAWRG